MISSAGEEIPFQVVTDGNGNRIFMIIKGLFRRYERWNPVHPTSGSFWGMGIGIGCGIGWGPGFGPEVIGYVGAGCGVGFSVGFTLLGAGIGLPTKPSIKIPYNGMRTGVVKLLRSSGFFSIRNVVEDGWNHFGPHIPFQREAGGKITSFKHKSSLDHSVGLTMMKPGYPSNFRSILERLESLRDRCLHPHKGTLTNPTSYFK
ncbi:cadmium-induced protein AS8 [Macadamia integrifolia]|uniref:cadmium-induced protein AS8 n=1 Tax=Macadamia integrifolia TaxID=60698 RepID=UPI001C4F188F|nr:cadmium-induced protein AS8 [Macadamia integrifolia]